MRTSIAILAISVLILGPAALTGSPCVHSRCGGLLRQALFEVDMSDTSRAVSCYRIPSIVTAPEEWRSDFKFITSGEVAVFYERDGSARTDG